MTYKHKEQFYIMEGLEGFGFNAETGTYDDLMTAGIVDTTKVSRLALQHAASVAGLFITTEAIIAEKPGKKVPSARAMPSDDMYLPRYFLPIIILKSIFYTNVAEKDGII